MPVGRLSRTILAGTLALIASGAAQAQSMNAERFHQRAATLKAKGPAALFAMGEVRSLMKEGKAAGDLVNARRLAAIKAGARPAYCPPDGPRSMTSDEFLRRLSAIPQARRSQIDMAEALTIILAEKFPCAG